MSLATYSVPSSRSERLCSRTARELPCRMRLPPTNLVVEPLVVAGADDRPPVLGQPHGGGLVLETAESGVLAGHGGRVVRVVRAGLDDVAEAVGPRRTPRRGRSGGRTARGDRWEAEAAGGGGRAGGGGLGLRGGGRDGGRTGVGGHGHDGGGAERGTAAEATGDDIADVLVGAGVGNLVETGVTAAVAAGQGGPAAGMRAGRRSDQRQRFAHFALPIRPLGVGVTSGAGRCGSGAAG